MRNLWRISSYADLSGEGAKIVSARWHSKGNLVVYLAETAAGAMLERLVHLLDNEGQLPLTYDLLRVVAAEEVATKDLMPLAEVDWKERTEFTRKMGDTWLASLESPLARVPSAIMPFTWNYLLNPAHSHAKVVTIQEVIRERFDNRLFRFGPR
ncbi:MAG: RES family NAD+ phosphorylase [Terracidiphilus sp.]